ncbi:MAG: hypothetical protein KatS3mg076_0722 [Candidatus Binatia bacterium]|nr:MAG: hypothetical protein KatS3mg076_0722 [Candidatus Binatia bacterium]
MSRKFAVDRMLGRLATWLRLTGQDASYGSHLRGRALLRHARSESRTVLTRDRSLARKCQGDPEVFLVSSDHFREQLREVVRAFGIDPYRAMFSRCPRCNVPLERIPREAARPFVPRFVFETAPEFVRCGRCRRVYWPGTHAERVREELRRILGPENLDSGENRR